MKIAINIQIGLLIILSLSCLIVLNYKVIVLDIPTTQHPHTKFIATYPIDDWLTSTPEEQEMDSEPLESMLSNILNQSYAIDSVVIVRNGNIVFEDYPRILYSQSSKHALYSVTKSFSSALIGIAIEKGLIDSVDQKLLDFFPDRNITNYDSRKYNITLEHLLMMRSGFEWDEWTYPIPDSRNDVMRLISSVDSIQFLLERQLISDPGTNWLYNTGDSHLLSAIITQVSGQSALEFAQENLFDPLGITDVYWLTDTIGLNYGGFDLYLNSRDIAKFGYLYLNNGSWDGEQIIPAEWVTRSTDSITTFDYSSGYGYQWWTYLNTYTQIVPHYAARGLYGQTIWVVPEYNLVVVFTANIRDGYDPEQNYLYQYVIPAIVNFIPLNTTETSSTDLENTSTNLESTTTNLDNTTSLTENTTSNALLSPFLIAFVTQIVAVYIYRNKKVQ
ncbi:MAG: serine hydrolase domain-containing protein [Candidatus Hodarchaeales archaeon]